MTEEQKLRQRLDRVAERAADVARQVECLRERIRRLVLIDGDAQVAPRWVPREREAAT